ncbi:cytoskeleton-associated protein 2-like [Rhynchocyon petersi]
MSVPAVPRHLQLPPSQRTQPAFREQRRQKLEQHLLQRRTGLVCKQEHQLSSSRDQKVMTSEVQDQHGTDILKLKTKMADKENSSRPTPNKRKLTTTTNCIPSKPSKELINSTLEIDSSEFESNTQHPQLLPIKDNVPNQHMTFSQAFHLKKNNKKQIPAEKLKQEDNIPKKYVLGSYCGQVVESKVKSFRKSLQVKDESSAANKKRPSPVSNASKPQPINTSDVTVRRDRVSDVTSAIKAVSTSQNRQRVQPPVRRHHNKSQDQVTPGISRTSANVTVQKEPHRKESFPLKTGLSRVKTSSSADVKGDVARSRSTASGGAPRPALSTHKMLGNMNQRRHTIAKASVDKPRETAEQRKARLTEWRASRGRVLKRPPGSIVHQPEPEGQNEKPLGSFWTTMAEEDEQRLFTVKVNKTFSECLNLIDEGCPREEILIILDDLIKNIPGATKLVKYWVCLARLEPITSPIENIFAIYEKAILARAQPIEEMRHAIADILTMKSQEKVDLEQENPEGPAADDRSPGKESSEGCLIKYNVSSTPYLQSAKKKIQCDETNTIFKELKFLTPVRRSHRLQDKTSKLPDMLKDHYPCVSSLEQLAELGGETDAFVCRPNTALCRMFSEIEITEEK